MNVYKKVLLSGSTSGRGVLVGATGTPGTLIHTAVDETTQKDEVWIYVTNSGTALKKLTIEFGGVTAPDDQIELNVSGEVGLVLVVPGLVLEAGVEIRAFAETADVISVWGYVHRIIEGE